MSIYICGWDIPWVDSPLKNDNMDEPYKCLVPYKFSWRAKLGRAVCDCAQVIEVYEPWYGVHWEHTQECAIEKHIRRYPGIQNLVPWTGILATSDWQ